MENLATLDHLGNLDPVVNLEMMDILLDLEENVDLWDHRDLLDPMHGFDYLELLEKLDLEEALDSPVRVFFNDRLAYFAIPNKETGPEICPAIFGNDRQRAVFKLYQMSGEKLEMFKTILSTLLYINHTRPVYIVYKKHASY